MSGGYNWDVAELRKISIEYEKARDAGKVTTYEEWAPFMKRKLDAFGGDWGMAIENMALFAKEEWVKRFVEENKK